MSAQPQLPFSTLHDPPCTLQEPPSTLPELSLSFVRHPRARRYVIRVQGDGSIRVTIPRGGSRREAQAFADHERRWIDKELARVARERAMPREVVAPEIEQAMRLKAKRELPIRLLELAAEHKLHVKRISVRNQQWRWGSCSRRGHICLNWRLVTMPDWIRDYVIIHELMHLKRLDHSPAFWSLVAAACPRYQEARAWLRSQVQKN